MMKTIGNEKDAFEWLSLLNDGKNPTPITNKEIQENPVFKIFNDQMKDDDTRTEIINAIKNRYNDYRNLKIKSLGKHDEFNLSEHTELGGAYILVIFLMVKIVILQNIL